MHGAFYNFKGLKTGENGEWSYPKALKQAHKSIDPEKIRSAKSGRKHSYLDIRFEDKDRCISILPVFRVRVN